MQRILSVNLTTTRATALDYKVDYKSFITPMAKIGFLWVNGSITFHDELLCSVRETYDVEAVNKLKGPEEEEILQKVTIVHHIASKFGTHYPYIT